MPATKMRVHRNGVPAEVQVPVHPGGVAVQYLDEDDNVLVTVVHDAVSIDQIAESKGLEVEEFDHGRPQPDPIAVAVETNAIDRGDAPPRVEESDGGDGGDELFDPSDHKVEEVLAYVTSDGISIEEVRRVTTAELDGKNRVTLTANLTDVIGEHPDFEQE